MNRFKIISLILFISISIIFCSKKINIEKNEDIISKKNVLFYIYINEEKMFLFETISQEIANILENTYFLKDKDGIWGYIDCKGIFYIKLNDDLISFIQEKDKNNLKNHSWCFNNKIEHESKLIYLYSMDYYQFLLLNNSLIKNRNALNNYYVKLISIIVFNSIIDKNNTLLSRIHLYFEIKDDIVRIYFHNSNERLIGILLFKDENKAWNLIKPYTTKVKNKITFYY